MDRIRFILDEFKKADITLSESQAEQFLTLSDFLVEYNKNVNLTSITDFEEIVIKHFVDSVLPFTMVDIPNNSSFVDVGTGAGFPSLPLMIVRNDLKATLVDSLEKRCVYLQKACDMLGINAEIIHARGEELGRIRREEFDFSCARAVAALPVLAEYCIPFVKTGGMFIALKSVNEDTSLALNAVKTLGGEFLATKDYKLTNGDDRRLVIIKKVRQTPTKYPRNSANIKKKPL